MGRCELNQVYRAVLALSWAQRRELMDRLASVQAGDEARAVVEDRLQALRMCPHCHGLHVVRNGMARGLQRYKCRDCGRTFNTLTGTPLARLRYRQRWLGQGQAIIEGLSVTKAAEQLQVARSTAFRWRHRFLALPHHVKAGHFSGIVEADETCWLKSCKGQPQTRQRQARPARRRGGRAKTRGLSAEHDVVLVVRDRAGACADQIMQALDTAHLAAVLQPVLATDAVLCTDGSAALAAAARHLGVEHRAINASAGVHAVGPWHINNVNGYHGRLKISPPPTSARGRQATSNWWIAGMVGDRRLRQSKLDVFFPDLGQLLRHKRNDSSARRERAWNPVFDAMLALWQRAVKADTLLEFTPEGPASSADHRAPPRFGGGDSSIGHGRLHVLAHTRNVRRRAGTFVSCRRE